MSAPAWVAGIALGVTVLLGVALARTRARLARVEARCARLDELVRGELAPRLAEVRADARLARATADDAAIAAGVETPPRRLPLEPVAGHVVRAVAFGASARRALARVAVGPKASRRNERRSA